ncbi:MAG: ArnT family glycosyltransferase [Candidatus Hodarchaeales archaeon]|jgi:hypothetical protein
MDFHKQQWLWTHALLLISFIVAFLLRVAVIDDYGFSEDEIQKVFAAESYKKLDFSANAAHPALSKLFIVASIIILGENEFALRFPNAIFGALTIYPIFLLGRKLYNEETGLLASFLWAVNIPGISFATAAKEDTLLTFFWVLSVYFFLSAEEDPRNLSLSGICVGLAASSKYAAFLLVLLLLLLFFYLRHKGWVFPSSKEFGLLFFLPAGISFLAANFPILLPSTLIGLWEHYSPQEPDHTGWIMMGQLFYQRPPYYILLHVLVKTPLPFLVILLFGVFFALKDRSEADMALLIWVTLAIGFFSITTYGYPRYYLVVIPVFSLLAAQGTYRFSCWLTNRIRRNKTNFQLKLSWTTTLLIILGICLHSIIVGAKVDPYYRMYVNELGGGLDRAGYYFPQDSVYDYLLREAIQYLNGEAPQGAIIAMSVPIVGEYYGRSDLQFIRIQDLPSDIDHWDELEVSYAIVQESRIYFENQDHIDSLLNETDKEKKVFMIFETKVAQIYQI